MLSSLILVSASLLIPAITVDTLASSTVIAEKGITVSRTDSITISYHMRAEDALMRLPCLLINDMGGPGGLKTVNLRGLGSAQTSIFIDGVRVGNLMSGQSDLSMFSFGSFSTTTVDYAQNSILFTSAAPEYIGNRRFSARASLTGGSFSTFMPSLSFGYRITDKVDASLNTAATISDGHRAGSGIEQYAGCIDFRGRLESGSWKAKGFMNISDRDCPGATTFPYPSVQKDMNVFMQGCFDRRVDETYTIFLSAKASYDGMQYSDAYSDAEYRQTEIQLNTSHLIKAAEWCDISISASGRWDGLKSGNYTVTPSVISRFSTIATCTASFAIERFCAEINAEYVGAYDNGAGRYMGRHCFCPAASLRYSIIDGLDITAFGKRNYHIPTFNDLYYISSGNPALKPEDAWLTDAGLEWHKNLDCSWNVSAKADAFFNFLNDKITWAPSPENPALWLPYNIGKVRSVGTDTYISTSYRSGGWTVEMSARYSFLDAVDVTSDTYGFNSQIAYTARHSVILCGKAAYKGWGADVVWNFRDGRKDSAGDMPSWNTLDFTAEKTFKIKSLCEITASITARNITDCRYEVSGGYPMPGWALYGGIAVRL